MTNVMLLGGPNSGKSTIIGGLIKHLTIENNKKDGYYTVVRETSKGFQEGVIDKMDNYEYPSKTVQHVVDVTVQEPNTLFFPQSEVMTTFDFGGEYQVDILGTGKGFLDLSNVERQYDQSDFQSEIHQQFTESLLNSKGFIFLLNLKNILFDRNEKHNFGEFISPATLESELVRQKEKNALVITAIDLVDYSPDISKDSLNTTTFDNTIYDNELFTRLNDELHSPTLNAMLRIAQDRNNFDLFGVSVPPGEGTDELLKDGGTFETNGFETLVEWILK